MRLYRNRRKSLRNKRQARKHTRKQRGGLTQCQSNFSKWLKEEFLKPRNITIDQIDYTMNDIVATQLLHGLQLYRCKEIVWGADENGNITLDGASLRDSDNNFTELGKRVIANVVKVQGKGE